MRGRSTRRSFLRGAGAAGLAGLAAPDAGAEAAPGTASPGDSASAPVPFYGAHQAGITTPAQEHLQFVSLDLHSGARSDLRALLQQLTTAAERLSRGAPVGGSEPSYLPPDDTGEALGLGPARLTVTIGLGPGVFRRGRFGLAHRRPAPLVNLPRFSGEQLQRRICGGDVALQVCADDPQVAFHAAHNLIRLVSSLATPRWMLAGFGKTVNSSAQTTPRNLLGFKEGSGNIFVEDGQALRRHVWAAGPESPGWMHGGSYMPVRRIRILLGRWDDISLDQQEAIFGRHKVSGAPLGGRHEHDAPDLGATTGGRPVIPADAHIRLASASFNRGARILRRGYSYAEGVDHASNSPEAGLLFICFNRDPRRQFIPMQRLLANRDALGPHTQHIGSALFACPPGAHPGGYVGETLLG